jgi:aldehyde dehydrogenase (NAD+)
MIDEGIGFKKNSKLKNTRLAHNKSNIKLSYSDALEGADKDLIKKKYDLFLDGEHRKAKKYFNAVNPSSGKVLSIVACASKDDVNIALISAKNNVPSLWSKKDQGEMAIYLHNIMRLIQKYSKELSIAEAMENGIPIKIIRKKDINGSIEYLKTYASWAGNFDLYNGYLYAKQLSFSKGIIAINITPNFPVMTAVRSLAPALLCGSTVLIKSGPGSAITMYKFAQIINETELPKGSVNFISGDDSTDMTLASHPLITKFIYSGPVSNGKDIIKAASYSDKILDMELGSCPIHIIFEDAPLDQAVDSIFSGYYFSRGYLPGTGSRIFVQESIFKKVVQKLETGIRTLRVRDPLDRNSDIGPILNAEYLKKLKVIISRYQKERNIVFQPENELPGKDGGFWFKPAILEEFPLSSAAAYDDIPGPIFSLITFRTPKEVIDKVNNSPYGMAAGVWTSKGSKGFLAIKEINTGILWFNTFNKFAPFSSYSWRKENGN